MAQGFPLPAGSSALSLLWGTGSPRAPVLGGEPPLQVPPVPAAAGDVRAGLPFPTEILLLGSARSSILFLNMQRSPEEKKLSSSGPSEMPPSPEFPSLPSLSSCSADPGVDVRIPDLARGHTSTRLSRKGSIDVTSSPRESHLHLSQSRYEMGLPGPPSGPQRRGPQRGWPRGPEPPTQLRGRPCLVPQQASVSAPGGLVHAGQVTRGGAQDFLATWCRNDVCDPRGTTSANGEIVIVANRCCKLT